MVRKIRTIVFPAIVVASALYITNTSASQSFAGGPAPFCAPSCAPAPICAPCVRTEQRTILVPQTVIECRQVPTTEIRREERAREVIVYRDVPETVQRTRIRTVLEPRVRSHEETYTVQRPVTRNVQQTYTVCVPYTEMRTGTRTVLKPVCREVERPYTVKVPFCEKRTGVRTVSRCVPVTHVHDVCVDRGHWECRVACQTCEPCRPCGERVAACKTRVWVPNMVHVQKACTVDTIQKMQVPYEYDVTVCRCETRTRIEKIREMVPVQESYPYEVHLTRQVQRCRTVQVCEYVPETRTRIVNETVCVPCQKTETYCETICHRVAEKRIVKEIVCVPVCTTRNVEVKSCRLVPKTIEVQVATRSACCVPTVCDRGRIYGGK